MSTYKKPLFVVGMPRSGTTLIQGILCNTKKYFPMPETHFFVRVAYKLPEKNLNKPDRERIRRKLFKKSRIKLDQEFPDDLNTQKDIFEYLIDQFNMDGSSSFLEKNTAACILLFENTRILPGCPIFMHDSRAKECR